jgi:hypothetical protein
VQHFGARLIARAGERDATAGTDHVKALRVHAAISCSLGQYS